MELRFDTMLYSNLGNQNYDAGHTKCSRGSNLASGPQVTHPCPRWLAADKVLFQREK